MASDLAVHMPVVATAILGDPNWGLSTKTELRYGTNGSLSVDLEKGTWYDHELTVGGGVLDFIKTRKGFEGAEAFAFLREIGCDVDDGPRRNGHDREADKKPEGKRVIEATYDYKDADGELVFQVVRCAFQMPDGTFAKNRERKKRKAIFQRRPDGAGGWVNNLQGVRAIPYRLAELNEAIADDRTVFIVEGEKKVDALYKIGIAATCAPMGAGKWPAHFAEFFAGARVVVMPDNDDPGRAHADQVCANLEPVVASNMVLELPELPPKGDVVDWLAEGGSAEDLAELAGTARIWTPGDTEGPRRSRFGAIRWHEQDEPHKPYEWAIKGLIPRRCPVMIVGAMQSGKSFWTYGASMAVARGVDFFGHRVTRPGGIIYGAMEAGEGFRMRMRAYRQHHGLPLDPGIPFAVLTREANLFNADTDVEALIEECNWLAGQFSAPLEAVVIDTYNAATPGLDENSAGEVSKVNAKMKAIMRRTGAGLWLVHHKNAQGGIRGSTALAAAFETVIEITRVIENSVPLRDADRRELRNAKVNKQREGEDGRNFNFVLPAVEIGRDADNDAITSCVIERPAGAGQERSTGRGFVLKTGNALTSYQALIRALGKAGGQPPAGEAKTLPRGAMAVHRDFWRDALLASGLGAKYDDASQRGDHVRKVLQRAMERLSAWGLIGVDYPWVWRTGKLVQGFDPPPHAIEHREALAWSEDQAGLFDDGRDIRRDNSEGPDGASSSQEE